MPVKTHGPLSKHDILEGIRKALREYDDNDDDDDDADDDDQSAADIPRARAQRRTTSRDWRASRQTTSAPKKRKPPFVMPVSRATRSALSFQGDVTQNEI